MNRIQAFTKPFDAIEFRDKHKSSHSLSFHDREDIRRRLASDSDNEDILTTGLRTSRKSSLISRLQSGQSLQICFMNESAGDTTSQVSDQYIRQLLNVCPFGEQESDDQSEDETIVDNKAKVGNNLDNCHIITSEPNHPKTSPNNNSCLDVNQSFNSINISNTTTNQRPNHLFTKLGFGSLDFNTYNLFSIIEKPSQREQFSDYHSKLHAEARHALAQVKNIVNKQIEIERNKVRIRSPVYELLSIPLKYKFRKNKLTKSVLISLNVSQLQLIVNDMFSQIESLNSELVQMLIRRDEQYMEQDSVLVDIEDLTIFLCSK